MWALKRKIFYIAIVVVFLLALGFLVSYPYFHQAPTCFDGKQDGNEMGIDCGGSCAKACAAQVDPISILWSRAFEVVPGRYNAVAYLENHNEDVAIEKINYSFRFADKDNIYIGKRDGTTFVPPKGKFAVFEPAINLGNSVPVYTTFSFTETPDWIQVPKEKVDQLQVFVSNIDLENENTEPKLSAIVHVADCLAHLIGSEFEDQQAAEHVVHQEGAEIADMGRRVNGRAAGVKRKRMLRRNRRRAGFALAENAIIAGEGVVESDGHGTGTGKLSFTHWRAYSVALPYLF